MEWKVRTLHNMQFVVQPSRVNEEFVERQQLNLTSKLCWRTGRNKKGKEVK
jgi:hypothetical protein